MPGLTILSKGSTAPKFNNADEEERKRRIAYGKAQGLDDATIQKYELIAKIQNQQKNASRPQAQSEQKKQPSGLKKFLVNTGALAGSIGAGIGSVALAPVTGGASLAGGFAAGAGIEALRRKLLGEKQNLGASALEGGLTILPGLLKGAKAIKGAKVAEEAVSASKVAKGAKGAMAEKESLKDTLLKSFKSTPDEGFISSKLNKGGNALKAEARGVKAGLKPQGAGEKLLPSGADKINTTLNTVERKGVGGRTVKGTVGGVPRQLRDVETAQGKALTAMDEALNKANKTVTTTDKSEIINGMRTDRKKILGLNNTHIKEASDLERRVKGAKDYKALEELRRSADERINFARNPSTPDPALEKVYLSLRRNIDAKVSALAPELKSAKTTFGQLEAAKDALVMNAPGTLKSGGSVVGKVAGSGFGQKGFDVAGNALKRTAKITSSPIVKVGTQQAIARSMTKPYLEQPATETGLPADPSLAFTQPQSTDEELLNQAVSAGITDPQELFDVLNSQNQPTAETAQTEVAPKKSEEYMNMADQYLAVGDIKTAKSYMDFAKVAADMEVAQAKATGKDANGKPLGAAQAKDVQNASSGLRAIDNLETIMKEDPSARMKTALPFRGVVGGAGNRVLGTGQIETARKEIADVITRLRTGAAINESEERFYKSQLPEAFDNEATVQQKLSQLRQLFEGLSNPTYFSDGSGSTGLDDISQLFNQGAM